MSDHRLRIGDVEIVALSDRHIEFVPSEFFPTVSQSEWEPYRDDLTPSGDLLLNVGSFLLRSDGRTVLVDTGLGESASGFPNSVFGLLLKDLVAQGISPDDIDMVVITHLHRDHVGWNFVREDDAFRPTFRNARYWIPKDDWDTFVPRARTRALAYIREQVVPLRDIGMLELMEGEQVLTRELTALPTPGHTPGHTSVVISSNGEHGIIFGDAAHVPAQAQETHWSPKADMDPERSRISRRDLMDRAERDDAMVVSGHFPAPGYGRLVRSNGRRYWQPHVAG